MTGDHPNRAAGGQNFSSWMAAFHLLTCLLGFAFAVWLYRVLAQEEPSAHWPTIWLRETVVSGVTAWVALAFTGSRSADGARLWIDRLFSVVGFNLIVQYGLGYLLHLPPSPWPAVCLGSLFAIAAIAALQPRLAQALPEDSGGSLLLGYDAIAEAILPYLHGPLSVLGRPTRTSPPILGDLARFDDVVASANPSRIVVNQPDWAAAIPPRRLLALRYAGVVVEDAPAVYENVLKRVCWQRLSTLDLLLSPRLNINRSAIALQAIYTNVIGLALLVLLSPVLILGAVMVAINTAAAPFHGIECSGFQRIPFRLLRFRTASRRGEPVWSGRLLRALHLVDLPQLINVVRGEMALFGPPPVRREFAARLSQLIPVYPHRFSVKPGIMGWSQANLAAALPVPDESLRLEYDIYYIREESPSLDLDILFRTVSRKPLSPAPSRQ